LCTNQRNGTLVARTLDFAALQTKAKTIGPQELDNVVGLVTELAASVKDRSPCQLVVGSKAHFKLLKRVGSLSPESCGRLYASTSDSLQARCMAGRSLAGKLMIGDQRVGSADRKALLRSLGTMALPERVMHLVLNAFSLGGEVAGLALSIPLLYWPLRHLPRQMRTNQLPVAEEIGGLLSTAYDRHTLEGTWALNSFAINCRPYADLMQKLNSDGKRLIGNVIFIAEGSAVDRNVDNSLLRELYVQNEASLCIRGGLPYEAFDEVKGIVLDNLPLLNESRRRVVNAGSRFASSVRRYRQGVLFK
jgi:hypothetical protein